MGGHAFRRENKKEAVGALTESARRTKGKVTKRAPQRSKTVGKKKR